MLFNSYEFIFLFFPVVLTVFFIMARWSHPVAISWLGLASLFFYGWWSNKAISLFLYTISLLLFSVCSNYLVAKKIAPSASTNDHTRKLYFYCAIAANLSLLGYFKYADFFISNLNVALSGLNKPKFGALNIVLPIGISFFTFTQIAFLADCWRGKVKAINFKNYLLFVTYFPHLIAGPILHHSQMMPQFVNPETRRLNYDKIVIGILIFTFGLAKKLLIADPMSTFADAYFTGLEGGNLSPMFFSSWLGVLAYTFQIYFDFSGYSDMAIGLSLFFGIHLPINFNSPYTATSIIDFWRRWHISLSAFLRDYLYVPLGGNRNGQLRRHINILITMLLGGLWHGANWTFVMWGAAHAVLLIINHEWRKMTCDRTEYGPFHKAFYWLLTFIFVCLTWVLFRSNSVAEIMPIYQGLLGLNGIEPKFAHINFLSVLIAGVLVFIKIDFTSFYLKLKNYEWAKCLIIFTWTFLFFYLVILIQTPSKFLYMQF